MADSQKPFSKSSGLKNVIVYAFPR